MSGTLNASSSLEEVAGAYLTNASYDLSGGTIAQCEAFIQALRHLKMRRPRFVTLDGNQVTFDHTSLSAELTKAEHWLATNRAASSANGGGTAAVRTYDMGGIR